MDPQSVGLMAASFAGLVALIAAIAAVSGSSGGSPKTTPAKKDEFPTVNIPKGADIVPHPETFVAQSDEVVDVTGGLEGKQEITFNRLNREVPKIGRVIVVNVTPETPDGVLGRVEKVTQIDTNLYTIETVPVRLQDAYSRFEVNVSPGFDEAVLIEKEPVPGVNRTSRLGVTNSTDILVKGKLLKLPVECGSGADVSVTLDANNDFQVSMENLYIKIAPGFRMKTDFEAVRETKCILDPDFLDGLKIVFPVGGPVSLKLSPELDLGIEHEGAILDATIIDYQFQHGFEVGFVNGSFIGRPVVKNKVNEFLSTHGQEIVTAPSLFAKFGLDLLLGLNNPVSKTSSFADFELGGFGQITDKVSTSATKSKKRGLCLGVNNSVDVEIGARFAVKLFVLEFKNELKIEENLAKHDIFGPHCIKLQTPEENQKIVDRVRENIANSTTIPPIVRAGKLVGLEVRDNLSCQIESVEDGRSVYYDGDACSTTVNIRGQVYGLISSFDNFAGLDKVRVIMNKRSGAGTHSDPYIYETSWEIPSEGVRVHQTDRFVSGSGRYQTTIRLENTGLEAAPAIVYRANDCYLNNDDFGTTGFAGANGVGCRDSRGRMIEYQPLTAGATRVGAYYARVWDYIIGGQIFPDEITPGHYDDGIGISWQTSVNPGQQSVFKSDFVLSEPLV